MKVHYYNHLDSACVYKNVFSRKIMKETYCGRSIYKVKRHTEFKDSVTCLVCLHKINVLDFVRSQWKHNENYQ